MAESNQKRGTILDSSRNAVAKPRESLADLNLPPGTQALIEERINAALDQLREHNRDELARLAKEKTRIWRYIAGISTAVSLGWGIFSWFVAPEMVKKQADRYVQQHLTEPAMNLALTRAAQAIAVEYVDTKFVPLKKSADALKQEIASLKNEIAAKQDALAKAEDIIQSRVEVQRLSIDAKLGSAAALADLKRSAGSGTVAGLDAQTYLRDVDQYYDGDRYNLVQKHTVDPVTQQRPSLSLEEAAALLASQDSAARESAANILAELGKKSSVSLLVEALKLETNLRVISRITAALVSITKEQFKPLDKEVVLDWWKKNQNNTEFEFPADSYQRAFETLSARGEQGAADFSVSFLEQGARDSVPLFREVLKKEPAASQTRVFLVFALLRLSDVDGATTELANLEREQGNYWYLPVVRAAVFLARQKNGDAADALNQVFANYPSFAGSVRRFVMFKPLAENPRVKWPVQRAPAADAK